MLQMHWTQRWVYWKIKCCLHQFHYSLWSSCRTLWTPLVYSMCNNMFQSFDLVCPSCICANKWSNWYTECKLRCWMLTDTPVLHQQNYTTSNTKGAGIGSTIDCVSCHRERHANSKMLLQQNPSRRKWRCRPTQLTCITATKWWFKYEWCKWSI